METRSRAALVIALCGVLLFAGTTDRPGISSTTKPLLTIDSDAQGTQPADGAGWCIGGGSAPFCFKWDAVNNRAVITGPAGLGLALQDPGDTFRVTTVPDNTATAAAPPATFTSYFTMFGSLFVRAPTDAAPRRVVAMIDKDVTAFTVNGDGEGTTETTVYTFAVPQGLMGATGTLRVTASGTYTTGAVVASFKTKITFGGTTMWADDTANESFADTTAKPWSLTFTIQNVTAATQILSGSYWFGRSNGAGAPDTGSGMIVGAGSEPNVATAFRGTSAVDTSAAARTLAITEQLGGTSPTNAAVIVVVESVVLEAL